MSDPYQIQAQIVPVSLSLSPDYYGAVADWIAKIQNHSNGNFSYASRH